MKTLRHFLAPLALLLCCGWGCVPGVTLSAHGQMFTTNAAGDVVTYHSGGFTLGPPVAFNLQTPAVATNVWRFMAQQNPWKGPVYVASLKSVPLRFTNDWKGDVLTLEQAAAVAPVGAKLILVDQISDGEWALMTRRMGPNGVIPAWKGRVPYVYLWDTRVPRGPGRAQEGKFIFGARTIVKDTP